MESLEKYMYKYVIQQYLFKRRLFALKKTLWNRFDNVIFTEEYTVGALEAELLFERNITQTGYRPYSLQIFITVVRFVIFWLNKIWFLFSSRGSSPLQAWKSAKWTKQTHSAKEPDYDMDFAICLSGSRTQVYQRFNICYFWLYVFMQEGAGEGRGSIGQNQLLTHGNLSMRWIWDLVEKHDAGSGSLAASPTQDEFFVTSLFFTQKANIIHINKNTFSNYTLDLSQ